MLPTNPLTPTIKNSTKRISFVSKPTGVTTKTEAVIAAAAVLLVTKDWLLMNKGLDSNWEERSICK